MHLEKGIFRETPCIYGYKGTDSSCLDLAIAKPNPIINTDLLISVRTNSNFWNELNTEYLFISKYLTNRIQNDYSFTGNYSNSIRIPKTIRIVRKYE